MKCPKCGYLGFDDADRCRNCGYEFSLAHTATPSDLAMRFEEDGEPLPDLALAPSPQSEEPAPAATAAQPDRDELPLFGGPITDGAPLITAASAPRPPLAVRRSTPETPRLRAEYPRSKTLDLALDAQEQDDVVEPLDPAPRANTTTWPDMPGHHAQPPAGIGARFAAAIIDLAVLALVDLAVVYFTMQICGVGWSELDLLPKGPLIAFLLVQNGGYLIAFTAGGQTLGKMATGIRVVTAGSGSSLDVGRASLRTLMWTLLLVPAGLGLLTAVFSRDRRGLHDRFAGTRVVRASA